MSPSIEFSNGGGTADVTIQVGFRNNGNQMLSAPIDVTFYDDGGSPIGTASITADLRGCALDAYHAEIVWNDLAPGLHNFTVEIDSSNSVSESAENDNIGTGVVIIDPQQIFLPTVFR